VSGKLVEPFLEWKRRAVPIARFLHVDLLAGLILSCCGGRILNLCWEPASGLRRFIPV